MRRRLEDHFGRNRVIILDTLPIVKRKDIARTEQKNTAGEVIKEGHCKELRL